MADDIQALDSYPVCRLEINYESDLNSSPEFLRTILQFKGTTQDLIYHGDIFPRTFRLDFLLTEPKEKYDFLTFWQQVKGNYSKFWYVLQERAFELENPISSSDTSFLVTANNFLGSRQGNERVCFFFRNGDILTRQITDISYNETENQYTLETGVSFDRAIVSSDLYGIFFIVPVRFIESLSRITQESKNVSKVSMSILELVNEYPAET